MEKTKEILKKVRKLEIKTKHLVDGLMSGAYHSVFKGRGIEFSEVREYEYGDDIRTIDWNVTSRMNVPYVKEFIEERDLTVYIVFDISGSSYFGSMRQKKEAAVELAVSLMFSAMRNNDNVGLVMFTSKVEKYIPARKGRRHVLKLIRELITFEPKDTQTDIENSLAYLSKIIKKRSIIFIISDFFSKSFKKPISILKKNHDIIAVLINDTREMEIPDVGYIELEDEETGEQILVDTSDEQFRKKYSMIVKDAAAGTDKDLKKLKIDSIQIMTDEAYEVPLRKFFKMRARRVVS